MCTNLPNVTGYMEARDFHYVDKYYQWLPLFQTNHIQNFSSSIR